MEVSPEKQNLNTVFGTTRFSIDFYQRDYKWTTTPVSQLLDDVFLKFDQTYEKHDALPPSSEIIQSKYNWYYLNTYVTNKVGGKVFIVDGQQRLTTLSLMAIALLHLAKLHDSKLIGWIDKKIAGSVGFEEEFWMDHEGHRETQKAIKDDKIDSELSNLGITSKNMIKNFATIKKILTENLKSKHKLETFIFYFLERLILIELSLSHTDVPMVFEVINDRGISLAPYEILKGKLLGQIDKDELNRKKYNEFWDDRISSINNYGKNEADNFFRNYLRAKFTNTRSEAQRFDKDYHREISKNDFQKHLSLAQDQQGVLDFLEGPFEYFSKLYIKCLEGYDSDSKSGFLYNKAVDIDGASMLIISSCFENDSEKQEKLEQIPLELDRLYSLLQLQGAYNSNAFTKMLYIISANIREKPLEEIRPAFDLQLKEELGRIRSTKIESPFKYTYFKPIGETLEKRFKRYFFARVEEFFAENLKQDMMHNVHHLTNNSSKENAFHIEHILSNNEDNRELFDNDEELFSKERNRLGALLLLKGKDNQSSSNEIFSKKLKTYSGSLLWNQTLTNHFAHSHIDLKILNKKFELSLRAMDTFGAEEVEERQEILFKIAQQIWK